MLKSVRSFAGSLISKNRMKMKKKCGKQDFFNSPSIFRKFQLDFGNKMRGK